MRTGAIVLSTAALLLVAGGFDSVRGQNPPAEGALPTPIGKVVSATGAVTIEHTGAMVVQANASNQTKVGDSVFKGDVVSTGADGKVGIIFGDGTTFNVSSNARMVLNEFVYDPKSSSNSGFISLTKGTFTFIAGKVAKTGDMKIDTPVATMGIRGTTPHVEIRDDGTVAFSTLIEDKKAIEKLGGPKGRARRAAAAPPSPATASSAGSATDAPTSTGSIQRPEKKPNITVQSKGGRADPLDGMSICKGC
jgi:hypothetical protein